ncbi:hypothetical protein HPB47_018658, partial [Ixodes persulcatus]
IDPDCTEDYVKAHLQPSVGVAEVKRLGKTSPVVRVPFAGKVSPQHTRGQYASYAAECPVKVREREVSRYRQEHNTTLREAKDAVHARHQAIKETAESDKPTSRITINDVPSLSTLLLRTWRTQVTILKP